MRLRPLPAGLDMTAPLRRAVQGLPPASALGARRLTTCGTSGDRPTAPQAVAVELASLPPTAAAAATVPQSQPTRLRFHGSGMHRTAAGSHENPDPNKARLGKTLRILQERLPTLLRYPLPQEILAPNISLQLFPSTHPHLPTVHGRVAYSTALWTSPIAWNRLPGNHKLEIFAERMTPEPMRFLPRRTGAIPEQLVVRWREKECSDAQDSGNKNHESDGSALTARGRFRGRNPFTGLFIFDFDAEGKILTHTIEKTLLNGSNWERGIGAKFIGLTDWLLGGMKKPDDAPAPMFEGLRKPRGECEPGA